MRKLFVITSILSFALVVASFMYSQRKISSLQKSIPAAITSAAPVQSEELPVFNATYRLLNNPVVQDAEAASSMSSDEVLAADFETMSAEELREFDEIIAECQAVIKRMEDWLAHQAELDRIQQGVERDIAAAKVEVAELKRQRLSRPAIDYNPDYFGEGYDVPNYNDAK